MKPKPFSNPGFLLPTLLVMGLFTLRLMTPSNLMDKDQERPASYVLDVLQNGHWICQTDWMGFITSKPPLYTWLSALFALPFEQFNRFSLYLPSALSVLFLAWGIQASGGTRFRPMAGWMGALMFVLSPLSARLTVMARTDSLFTLMIAGTAFAAFRSWEKGGGWIWFWLAAAAATLTKGPLGILLGAMGLLAVFWERRRGIPLPLRGAQRPGLFLFFLLTAGWFALACLDMGRPVVDKMIFSELISHGMRINSQTVFTFRTFHSTLYFLSRFAPWSVIACIGLWRVFRHPAAEASERRYERFLTCWLLGGLAVFSLAPHQRGDLVYPILPPAAILAGREMEKRFSKCSLKALFASASAVSVLLFSAVACYYIVFFRTDPLVLRTEGMRCLAAEVRARIGKEAPLVYVDAPFALQFFLNTMQVIVPAEEAARQLDGSNTVYVAVCNKAKVTSLLNSPSYTVARWPETGVPFVTILSNQPLRPPSVP